MSISKFYTQIVQISRMVWSNESSSDVVQGDISAHIQQARPDYAESIAEAWAQTFILWCAKTEDIEQGDSLTVASGDYAGTYSVKNRQVNAVGMNQHYQVTIIKDK